MPTEQPSFTLAAFLEPYNLFALALAAFLSFRLPFAAPFFLIAELAYLSILPNQRWYRQEVLQRRQSARIRAMTDARSCRAARLTEPRLRAYERLLATTGQIARLSDETQGLPPLSGEDVIRLHRLLDAYVGMALLVEEWKTYLAQHPQNELERELDMARGELQRADAATRPLVERKVAILEQRREALVRMRGALGQMSAQLDLLENSFHLLHERVLAMQESPDRAAEIETLIELVSTTEQVVRDSEALASGVRAALHSADHA